MLRSVNEARTSQPPLLPSLSYPLFCPENDGKVVGGFFLKINLTNKMLILIAQINFVNGK